MLKTAENVTIGHPDKVCDQISDAILDECLKQDPHSRVAVETLGGHGQLVIIGEISSKAEFDAKQIAKDVYREVGYDDELDIMVNIVRQSPDIARGVDTGGAGDQGIMVGYATSETKELLPLEYVLATKLVRRLEKIRQEAKTKFARSLGPDGKAQVTIRNNYVESVVLSSQHTSEVDFQELKNFLKKEVVDYVVSKYKNIYINPSGPFISGGFMADTGLTGRKITADNYGPQIPVGGGAFSGKDATKVDRSAAYMARYLAIKYLKEQKANKVMVKLAYAIGKAEPVMAIVDIDGKIQDIKGYDLSPRAIIDTLGLDRPGFLQRTRQGFFLGFD